MKKIIFLFLITNIVFAQDSNSDGRIDNFNSSSKYDYRGNGVAEKVSISELINTGHYKLQIPAEMSPENITYSQYWSSPSGAFSNCWDGAAGYFDNDTLLDIAGYTFGPNMFYIWEQSPTKPDSFALVYQYTKTESGGFGPLAVGDIDGDGKVDFVLSDFSTLSRIYIISNTGNNTYVSRETQNIIVHPNDGSTVQSLLIGDLNKNGQKEIICTRNVTSPSPNGMLRIWEHTGSPGTFNFSNIYTYNTVTTLSGKSGIGDSDGDGWDEVFLTYSAFDTYNTFIRKIKYDSASGTFQHQIFTSTAIGIPTSYRVADVNNDGIRELISTESSNSRAACYIFRSTGQNLFQTIDSIFENSDASSMLTADVKLLTGDIYPTILCGSYSGKIYMYQYNGSHYPKIFENDNYPGSAIRRVYWLPWTGYDGYFNVWSSTGSYNSTFYLFKKDAVLGVINNETPVRFMLQQNYPNPFNPGTVISYQLAVKSDVRLTVYDIMGKEIAILVNQNQNRGSYKVDFKAGDLSSGIYFYKLETDGQSEIRKMILLK
jgi:hypothetical protein